MLMPVGHIPGLAGTRTAMKLGDERRTEELGHLKLALATFALQLDAFELRTHEVLLAVEQPLTDDPLAMAVPRIEEIAGRPKDNLSGGQ